MSRHRRQQRRRAGRAHIRIAAARARSKAWLDANWTRLVDGMYTACGVSEMRSDQYEFRQPQPLEWEGKPIPPALATADALFAVLGFRRVE